MASDAGDRSGEALRLGGVRFAWPGTPRFGLAVDNFAVARGERVLLLGPSGLGKSTLLSLICGIAAPDAGAVEVLGRPFSALPGARRDRLRAEHFGVIFQMFNLLPYATPLDNVLLPLSFAPRRRARLGAASAQQARQLMASLGLPPGVVDASAAAELSVGQQQRVAVARALIGEPEIIVADEPTSALDAAVQDVFLRLLFDQVAAAGATLLMVSHDERLAPRFDRVVQLPEIAEARREQAA